MKKPLQRISKPLTRLQPTARMSHATRKPLAFLPPEADPLRFLGEAENNEKAVNAEVQELRKAIVSKSKLAQTMKDAKARLDRDTAADDYFVLCFETGEQAVAFLRAIGYKHTADRFIDGTIIAELLKIELPKPTARMKLLKTDHDQKLVSLVQPKWRQLKR